MYINQSCRNNNKIRESRVLDVLIVARHFKMLGDNSTTVALNPAVSYLMTFFSYINN